MCRGKTWCLTYAIKRNFSGSEHWIEVAEDFNGFCEVSPRNPVDYFSLTKKSTKSSKPHVARQHLLSAAP